MITESQEASASHSENYLLDLPPYTERDGIEEEETHERFERENRPRDPAKLMEPTAFTP
jgi:hypothetical protein